MWCPTGPLLFHGLATKFVLFGFRIFFGLVSLLLIRITVTLQLSGEALGNRSREFFPVTTRESAALLERILTERESGRSGEFQKAVGKIACRNEERNQ
jgi:hypothetical protein